MSPGSRLSESWYHEFCMVICLFANIECLALVESSNNFGCLLRCHHIGQFRNYGSALMISRWIGRCRSLIHTQNGNAALLRSGVEFTTCTSYGTQSSSNWEATVRSCQVILSFRCISTQTAHCRYTSFSFYLY